MRNCLRFESWRGRRTDADVMATVPTSSCAPLSVLSFPLSHIPLTFAIHQESPNTLPPDFKQHLPHHPLWSPSPPTMEKPSTSRLHRQPVSGRRVSLIPTTPRQEPPTPSSSSSSTANPAPSPKSSSSNSRSGNSRRVMRRVGPTVGMSYPFTYQAAGIRNEELPPSAPVQPRNHSTGRRVHLLPVTPQPEGAAFPTSQPRALQHVGTSQPPETSGGDLYARIIREAMAKIDHGESEEEEVNSSESSSKAADQSNNNPLSPTSSSSLRFSTDDEDETGEGPEKRKRARTFEELASEAIRAMREAEKEIEGKSEGMAKLGEPSQIPAGVNNEEPPEDPIREIYDLTGTDDEAGVASDGWKGRMVEMVNMLVTESAQRGQMTKMVDLMERIVSWMDRETQSSNHPSPAVSVARQDKPLQNVPNADLAGPSRKRKSAATSSQPPSAAKRTRHSGSPGSQKKN